VDADVLEAQRCPEQSVNLKEKEAEVFESSVLPSLKPNHVRNRTCLAL
jgi:hypothetical protein